MASGENRLIRRRLAGAWLSTVISISLVLLLVGVAGLLVANARSVSDYFKENMQVSVLMKQEVGDDEAMEYVSDLDAKPFIKSTTFVSREQGAKEMTDLLGEDFLNVFEAAPIPVSVDVTLKADYVSSDSLEVVKNEIMKSPLVDEVVYQQSLVDKLNTNLRKISMVLGVFIVLLLFISFVLINNTVRLNVFSRRFTIHTMRLVGATKSFIRAPFLVQAVFQGLFSASGHLDACRDSLFCQKRVRSAFRGVQAGHASDCDRSRDSCRRADLRCQHGVGRRPSCLALQR